MKTQDAAEQVLASSMLMAFVGVAKCGMEKMCKPISIATKDAGQDETEKVTDPSHPR